jgi:hypothetical protein
VDRAWPVAQIRSPYRYSPIKIQSLELTDSKELRERVSGLGRLFRLVGAFAIARV